jgi:nicotinate-nucleotide pyrophosphorylase (carboxylating)
MGDLQFGDRERRDADQLIELALAEDLNDAGDITAGSVIAPDAQGVARFVARSAGVLAGMPVVARLAARFEMKVARGATVADGERIERGVELLTVRGSMRSLLAMERTALNFVQRLSGVATLTARFVAEVQGTRAVILDTRKTTPGWRALEKYAVRCGGGTNHRHGLFDAVLIKDNHLAWLEMHRRPSTESQSRGSDSWVATGDAVPWAIRRAREQVPLGTIIEIEVDTFDQFDQALACGPDIILVDNFRQEDLAEAVRRRNERAPHVLLEASGGITLETVRCLAETGVDRISVGALTHSAPALDIALDYAEEAEERGEG